MVQRFSEGGYGASEMEEDDHGDWVKYEDYAALEMQLLALRKEREAAVPVGVVRHVDVGVADRKGIHVSLYQQLPAGAEVFAAPPAQPVAVPDAICVRQAIANMEKHEYCDTTNVAYKHGWNDCRAAMLKAAK